MSLLGDFELLLDRPDVNFDGFAQVGAESVGLNHQSELLGQWLFEIENSFITIGPATPRFIAGHAARAGDEGGVAGFSEVDTFGERGGVGIGRWWRGGSWG